MPKPCRHTWCGTRRTYMTCVCGRARHSPQFHPCTFFLIQLYWFTPKTLATNGDDRQDLDVLVTPAHKTLFVEDRCVDRDLLWLSLSKWQYLASDCGQLPRCVFRLFSMLATVLAHECCTPLVYSSSLRFRGKSDTSSTFPCTQKNKRCARCP